MTVITWSNPNLPSEVVPRRRRREPRSLLALDPDLEWFLHESASELGYRGTMGAIIAAALSGSFGYVEPSEASMRRRAAAAERASRVLQRWRLLGVRHRRILEVHYHPRPQTSREAGWARSPDERIHAAIGFCAQVAVFFHKSPRKLLDACDRPHVSANDALIAAARQRAEGVVTAAQRAWFATGRRVVEAELEALG